VTAGERGRTQRRPRLRTETGDRDWPLKIRLHKFS